MNLTRAVHLLSRLHIKDRDRNISVPFILNANQAKAVKLMARQYEQEGYIRACFLKARRVGISSLMDALLFIWCLAFAQAHAEIVAHEMKTSELGLFRVPHDLAEELNSQFEVADVRTKRIYFHHEAGDSLMDIATAGSMGSGRGLTLNALHLSEAAQYPGADSFLSLLPAVSKGRDTIIGVESTAFGKAGIGETFYEFWNAASAPHNSSRWNGFIPIFLDWLHDPACVRDDEEAKDAPATDLERELMGRPYKATRGQIAWMRRVLESECSGEETRWLQEYPHCVTAETKVSTEKGIVSVLKSIELKCTETESGPIKRVIVQKPSVIWRLDTEQGRVLRGTGDHPVKTPFGFTYLSGLSTGDEIELCPPMFSKENFTCKWRNFPGVQSSVEVDELWGRFIGYFMGDGSWYKRIISIVCDAKDWDVHNDVDMTVRRLFGKSPNRRVIGKKQGRRGAVEYRFWAGEAEESFFKLGLLREGDVGAWKRKVHVPECIFRSPKSVVRQFLQSLFECDGSASSGLVRFATSNHEFVRDVQLLLLGFGINSRIYENVKKGGSGKKYICYELTLTSDTLHRFGEVGFVGARKRKLFEESVLRQRESLRDLVSVPVQDYFLYDRVKSVTVETVKKTTYDFTIRDSHIFSANGILTHNCPEVAFVSTGDPAFPRDEMVYAESTKKDPLYQGRLIRKDGKPEFEPSNRGPLLLWEKPMEKCHYYVGADAAAGYETGDFSAYAIFNGTTGRQAGRYSDHSNPEELAEQCDLVGRWFNNAIVNIELTGNLGRWAQVKLRDKYFYPNIYRWKGKDDKLSGRAKSDSAGWETNNATRGLMRDAFREKLRAGMKGIPGGMEIYDGELIQQMSLATLRQGMKWEVERGHDDILVAWLLAVVTCSQYPPPNVVSFKGNYMEKPENKHNSVESALHAQPNWVDALKRDLKMILRPEPKVVRTITSGGI